MNFYLDGENTDQLLEQVEFDGDWKYIRGRILGKNKKDFKGRKFKVTLYLVNTAGKLGNEVVEMLDRSSLELLVETIGSMSTELAENSEHDIDLPKSYAVVRA